MALLIYATLLTDFLFVPAGAFDVIHTETGISPYVRSGIKVLRGAPTLYLEFADQTDVWTSHYSWSTAFELSYDIVRFYDDFGVTTVARVRTGAADRTQLEIWLWDGAAWQSQAISATGVIVNGVVHRFDVHLKIDDSTGVFEVFVDGVSVVSVTSADTKIDTTTTVNTVGYRGNHDFSFLYTHISACMIWDEDTTQIWYNDLVINGNGGNTGWNGDYTDVDELELDIRDKISTSSDAQEETYTHAGKHADFAADHTVVTVGMVLRARNGQGSQGSLKGLTRHNSVNGETISVPLTNTIERYRFLFPENPDTEAAWALGDIDSAEFGVKSEKKQVDVSQLNTITVYENKAELSASQLNIITVYENTAEVMATQLNIITVYEDTS